MSTFNKVPLLCTLCIPYSIMPLIITWGGKWLETLSVTAKSTGYKTEP